ncbi:head-tail connector protein [Tepidibacter mesophilus]|uniref:head-tail connector protein n=1 Tax=Tepidibacter mesophilus TaxID=655607 RepID=UPI000C077468|nr:head-tail connector protein [Tepidibacter mesophilus]
MVTIEQAKRWLRIDYTDDDEDIQILIDTAKDYIINATDINVDTESNLFNLAMRMLIRHWYDNRNIVIIGTISKNLEKSLSAILAQLKYSYDYTE